LGPSAYVAFAAGMATLALPEIQFAATLFMMEIPIAFFQLLAVWFLVEYFRTGSNWQAALFGLTAAMAMLVKGNALALVMVPPLMIIFGNRWDVVRQRGLYVAYAIIVIVGLPWQFVSLYLLGDTGLVESFSLLRTARLFGGYAAIMLRDTGFALTGFSVIITTAVVLLVRKSNLAASPAALGVSCLFIATFAFHCIAPNPGPDGRYLVTAYCCVVVLAVTAVWWLAGRVTTADWARQGFAVLLVLISVLQPLTSALAFPQRPPLGYRELVAYMTENLPHVNRMLICSDANGEGAFIQEVAFADSERPQRIVIRGTKALSTNRWSETVHQPNFMNSTDLLAWLKEARIDAVVIDQSQVLWVKDRDLLMSALVAEPSVWSKSYETNARSDGRQIVVITRVH
jgi:hypothetical protein